MKVGIQTLPSHLEPQKILTQQFEDSWPASTGLLRIYYLPFQDLPTTLRSITPKIVQPTDKRSIISWRHLWGIVRISGISFFLNSAIPFSDKGLKWFGQDQGLLVQALKRVGTLPIIPTATVNRRLPCSLLLSNICSPWLPPQRS